METTERIVRWCEQNQVRCSIYSDELIFENHKSLYVSLEEMSKVSEVIITLGGDGSILASANAFGKYGLPILGVNLGKLGFLTEVAPDRIEEALLCLKKNQFKIEERLVIEAVLPDGQKLPALNDVVVDHGEQMRLAMIDLFSNGEFVCPYDADGIIIATPTGSTAYSLSAGGPIITPTMDAIAVSPISPHTLALRCIIFPAQNVLTVRDGSSSVRLRITIDGHSVTHLERGEEITVRKAGYRVKLIKFESKSYYEVLRSKLHWGARPLFNS